jgi:hypothetical protein
MELVDFCMIGFDNYQTLQEEFGLSCFLYMTGGEYKVKMLYGVIFLVIQYPSNPDNFGKLLL